MSENMTVELTSVDELRSWLVGWLAGEMGLTRPEVDPGRSFLSYGMDSVQAMTMVGDLESHLGLRLPPTLAWDYPDIDALANHLADRAGTPPAILGEAPPSFVEAEGLLADLDGLSDDEVDRLLGQFRDGSA